MTITILIKTDLGDIEAELYPQQAPVTVANFLANIACGLYEGGSFFRAASSCRALNGQNGISVIEATKAEWKTGRAPIPHESTQQTGLLNDDGVLAMSRAEPGTAAFEFFINIGHNAGLDFQEAGEGQESKAGYAAFGRVIRGMEVVREIHGQPKGQRVLSDSESEMMDQLRACDPAAADWMSSQLLNQNIRIHSMDVR